VADINPYLGKLGLTCERVVEYEFVGLDGKFIKTNKEENAELVWASCGDGGAHYGVMHRFSTTARDGKVFNSNVNYRNGWGE
jgi:hypothetical protein